MIREKIAKSEFYDTLAWMGLLSTEEYAIRKSRETDTSLYVPLDLVHTDIDGVGYLHPHFELDKACCENVELWLDNRYLNPKMLTWITGRDTVYGILDRPYDELTPVMSHYNPDIIYRFSNINTTDHPLTHTVIIDLNNSPYLGLENPEHCAYYISENSYHIPEVTRINDHQLMFKITYAADIDFFICSNLANVIELHAGQSVYVDHLYSNRCYHRYIIDHDPSIPFDARFYPCILPQADGIMRVYNDTYHQILHPEVSRLLAYPEFLEITDPYHCDNEYLRAIEPLDIMIQSTDSDVDIIEKFGKIAQYCYRMWEQFPYNTSEVSNFIICDNSEFGYPVFTKCEVHLTNEVKSAICPSVPYEPYRDILFYGGMVFSDYSVSPLRRTADGLLVENPTSGLLSYVIADTYDPDKFTLIKFNTDRDTNFVNIGEYISEENIARLHIKLNRFYRNLLVVRNQLLDMPGDADPDYIRIATVQPENKTDDYLWFELLTNVIPEMFETQPIDEISLYGLDPDNIPNTIKTGAYMLELEPGSGPASYRDILETYFNLSKGERNYLALQHGEGKPDPRIQTIDHVNIGDASNFTDLNALTIDDSTIDPGQVKTTYEEGYPEEPQGPHQSGDLYLKNHDMFTPPPDEENIPIDEISMGPQTPGESEHTLWIDTNGESLPGLIPGGSLDSVSESITLTNQAGNVSAEPGRYIAEGATVEEEITIDSLLSDLADQPSGASDTPETGSMMLEPIQYMDDDGNAITMDEIRALSTEQKLHTIRKLITCDHEPDNASTGDLWIDYLSHTPPGVLNFVVYKVLLTAHVYDINQVKYGDLALEGDTLPEETRSIVYGDYPRWTTDDQLLLQPYQIDDAGRAIPEWNAIREHNVRYIMSYHEPDDPKPGDMWINIPAAVLVDIIKDVISSTLYEIGEHMPAGEFDDSGYESFATMGLDYYPHDKGTEGIGELFRERIDTSLHKVHYGETVDSSEFVEDDIWYEFIDTVANKVAYSDQTCMVLELNERLVMIQFDHDNITAFAFDDVFMNFRGTLGIKYLSVVADLVNSGKISLDDLVIFYKRLITVEDDFDPKLQRLYTGTSYVVSTANIEPSDYAVLYSSNIGRFRMDYSAPETTNRERAHAYRMCIDLTSRKFSFLYGRMLLFVNGKYIPQTEYKETPEGRLQLTNFHEIIATVDILYDTKDENLMALKHCTKQYFAGSDDCVSIQRPSQYGTIEPITITDYTKRGYYDILIRDFILSGKLRRIIQYLADNPEEYEDYRRELIQQFHAISDIDLCGRDDRTAKIVISGNAHSIAPYIISNAPQDDKP